LLNVASNACYSPTLWLIGLAKRDLNNSGHPRGLTHKDYYAKQDYYAKLL